MTARVFDGWVLVAGAVLVAFLSLLVIPAAPSYDPWMWLVWGRELAGGSLSTVDGPAVKPLPMAVGAVLAGWGEAAPTAWVVIARAGAVVAVVLAGVIAWSSASAVLAGAGASSVVARGGAVVAGALAGVAVVLTAGTVRLSATGGSEGLLVAFGLAGAFLVVRGAFVPLGGSNVPRSSGVLWACVVACALLRVEAWPFALLMVLVSWRGFGHRGRVVAAACVVAVPAIWFGLEWLGSGDPWRSGSRALTPETGQPALAELPFLASLRDALALGWWPMLLGAAGLCWGRRAGAAVGVAAGEGAPAARRALRSARGIAAVGFAWVLLVAVMAQAGFSGEQRYAWPGVVLLTVAAVVGWVVVGVAARRWSSRATRGAARRWSSGAARGARAAIVAANAPRVGGAEARQATRGADAARVPADTPRVDRTFVVRRAAVAFGALLVVVASVLTASVRIDGIGRDRAAVAYQHRLHSDLRGVVTAAGGRDALLRCGRPVVGPRRGPMVAWRLRLRKEQVAFRAGAGTVVLQSALRDGAPVVPSARRLGVIARAGLWTARGTC